MYAATNILYESDIKIAVTKNSQLPHAETPAQAIDRLESAFVENRCIGLSDGEFKTLKVLL